MPRPLLICDCDEVLVQFIAPFEAYLAREGYSLSFNSLEFAGNIRHEETGAYPDRKAVRELLFRFFDAHLEETPLMPGAAQALQQISEVADIVILTNIDAEHRERRAQALAAADMPYRVLSNRGLKGKAVQELAAACTGPWLFVDDLSLHHQSVAATCPDVNRLHFVADPRIQQLVPDCPEANARFTTWEDALPWALSALSR